MRELESHFIRVHCRGNRDLNTVRVLFRCPCCAVADKYRENYLGHSVKAPVGRWQKNKDLFWYDKATGRQLTAGMLESVLMESGRFFASWLYRGSVGPGVDVAVSFSLEECGWAEP